ncbi:MAG: polyphosphate polymerase domain-containing protein [Lachnospiraceae bacterium]|nr:polyphosphate polymerase domain-containing protein [Lachnospiraceae bacterium]
MNKNTLRVYRHEVKFLLSMTEYEQLKRLLGSLLIKDVNMKRSGDYYIRSLYFDTPENSDYHDKLIGAAQRKKIRLRIYDTAADRVKLEIKNKNGDYSIKETTTISREAAILLSGGNYGALDGYGDDISGKAYVMLSSYAYMPKVLVDYEREAYLLPVENVRLTFDKRVRACSARGCRAGAGLFDGSSAFVGVLEPGYMILEVKYDRYLPAYVKNVLSSINMQRMSISKYCMARETVG